MGGWFSAPEKNGDVKDRDIQKVVAKVGGRKDLGVILYATVTANECSDGGNKYSQPNCIYYYAILLANSERVKFAVTSAQPSEGGLGDNVFFDTEIDIPLDGMAATVAEWARSETRIDELWTSKRAMRDIQDKYYFNFRDATSHSKMNKFVFAKVVLAQLIQHQKSDNSLYSAFKKSGSTTVPMEQATKIFQAMQTALQSAEEAAKQKFDELAPQRAAAQKRYAEKTRQLDERARAAQSSGGLVDQFYEGAKAYAGYELAKAVEERLGLL